MRVKAYMTAVAVFLLCSGARCSAQKFAVSTNAVGYLNLCTMNIEASYALSRHFSLNGEARYNPFTFHKGQSGQQFQNRQRTFSLGARYWPWYVYSGWWFAAKARWSEYNCGGMVSDETTEGVRIGGGLAGGYSYMVHPHFNIDFGAGVWLGSDRYTKYACPGCGRVVGSGGRFFFLPGDLIVSFVYVF